MYKAVSDVLLKISSRSVTTDGSRVKMLCNDYILIIIEIFKKKMFVLLISIFHYYYYYFIFFWGGGWWRRRHHISILKITYNPRIVAYRE